MLTYKLSLKPSRHLVIGTHEKAFVIAFYHALAYRAVKENYWYPRAFSLFDNGSCRIVRAGVDHVDDEKAGALRYRGIHLLCLSGLIASRIVIVIVKMRRVEHSVHLSAYA